MAQDRTRVDIPSEYRIPLVMRPYEKSPSYEEAQAYTDKYGDELINPDNSGVNLPQTTEERNNEKIVNNLENLGDVAMNLWDATDLLHIPASVAKEALVVPVTWFGKEAARKAQPIYAYKSLYSAMRREPTRQELIDFMNLPEEVQDIIIRGRKPWSKNKLPIDKRIKNEAEGNYSTIFTDKENNIGLHFNGTENPNETAYYHNMLISDKDGNLKSYAPIVTTVTNDPYQMHYWLPTNTTNYTKDVDLLDVLHEDAHGNESQRNLANLILDGRDNVPPFSFVSTQSRDDLKTALENSDFLKNFNFEEYGKVNGVKDHIITSDNGLLQKIPLKNIEKHDRKLGFVGDVKQLEEGVLNDRPYLFTDASHAYLPNEKGEFKMDELKHTLPSELNSYITEMLSKKEGHEFLKKYMPNELEWYMNNHAKDPRVELFEYDFDELGDLFKETKRMKDAGMI